MNETHAKLAMVLGVPPNTIKNWRDEFDPIHDNPRQGWYQRRMGRSRIRTVDALGHLTEYELHSIVADILKNPNGPTANELVRAIGDESDDAEPPMEPGIRGPIGHKAEKLFQAYHATKQLPKSGHLVDCRYDQCGYDFRIESDLEQYFVEVKGIAAESGRISFTNKEWETAIEHGERYFLVVVKNIDDQPEYVTIQNPAKNLAVEIRVYTTIQTGWSARIPR